MFSPGQEFSFRSGLKNALRFPNEKGARPRQAVYRITHGSKPNRWIGHNAVEGGTARGAPDPLLLFPHGVMKKLAGWLKGADQPEYRTVEPALVVSRPSQESRGESVAVAAPASLLPPHSASAPAMEGRKAEPKRAGVKKVLLDEAGLSVLDLRELPSSRFSHRRLGVLGD